MEKCESYLLGRAFTELEIGNKKLVLCQTKGCPYGKEEFRHLEDNKTYFICETKGLILKLD